MIGGDGTLPGHAGGGSAAAAGNYGAAANPAGTGRRGTDRWRAMGFRGTRRSPTAFSTRAAPRVDGEAAGGEGDPGEAVQQAASAAALVPLNERHALVAEAFAPRGADPVAETPRLYAAGRRSGAW
eukprot:6189101-Pleurochrysis_carterae.AAC.1